MIITKRQKKYHANNDHPETPRDKKQMIITLESNIDLDQTKTKKQRRQLMQRNLPRKIPK